MRFVEGKQGPSILLLFSSSRREWQIPAHVLAATVCGVLLGSCGPGHGEQPSAWQAARAPIPVPDAALLKAQPQPACEYNGASADQAALSKPPDAKVLASVAEAELRTKLDYERQCYRHAEMIARRRLDALQASVRATIRAIDRSRNE
jgi:hypothetical protein